MKNIKANLGSIDKYLRVTGIIILLFLYNYSRSDWFLLGGIILSITVVIGWCPVYAVAGINTCKKINKERDIF